MSLDKKSPEYLEQFVPTNLPPYHDHDGLLGFLALGAKNNYPVLIQGETGTGKTTAVRTLASKAQKPYRRVNLNGGTTADELLGMMLLNEKGTFWQDGILTEAVRLGMWIVLDEINAAGADVLFSLHSLLDDDRMLVLLGNDGEVVRPHEEFRLFATMNPSGEYAGTREMNKALVSRFPLVLTANYPSENEEVSILVERTKIKSDFAASLVKIANEARNSHREGLMDFPFSTRDLLNVCEIAKELGGDIRAVRNAIPACVMGKCNSEDQLKIVDLLDLHLPDTK